MDGPWYCYKTLSLNFHFIDKKGILKAINCKSNIPSSWLLYSEKLLSILLSFRRVQQNNDKEITTCVRCHQLTQNLCRKWVSTPESTKAQLVAEQEGLAWAICKWEQGRNCLWNLLGGFIYVLGCLNECLQNSINSNKQTYLQSEQPPLCAGFGFLETRMEKK